MNGIFLFKLMENNSESVNKVGSVTYYSFILPLPPNYNTAGHAEGNSLGSYVEMFHFYCFHNLL